MVRTIELLKKMKFEQITIIILKNLLILFCGAALGALLLFIYLKPALCLAMPKDAELAVIALAPITLIIYSIFFTVGGGVLGFIVYNSILFFKRLKKSRKTI